jgi:hypothetical protein
MWIGNIESILRHERRRSCAEVTWEDSDLPTHPLQFEVPIWTKSTGLSPEAFLLACFPLAARHGEQRVHIDAPVCPMLVEGLHTVHAWWVNWGLINTPMPKIEAPLQSPRIDTARRSSAFLSGGLDSLHMLLRNRKMYRPSDPAYIHDALVIHGFDIGKRNGRLESEHFELTIARLTPLAAAVNLRLVPCWSNLRQLPTLPGVWSYLHHGAALAAVANAATIDPVQIFIGATFHVKCMMPWGSHPLIDVHYSSQRVAFIHEGSRFSRLEKVREVAESELALASLRVCPANVPGLLNCGNCEKCIRTRLELLAAGHDHTPTFGPSAVAPDTLERNLAIETAYQASFYHELVAPLAEHGFRQLSQILADKLDARNRRKMAE